MNYKYANHENYEDYASGRVIYHKGGMPNFPVRLAEEIFQRCLSYIDKEKVSIYDPCCGNGYMLTVLSFLNLERINKIIASDINPEAIIMAQSNLGLLKIEGLLNRKKKIEEMIQNFNKPSNYEALDSVNRFIEKVKTKKQHIDFNIFNLDILKPNGFSEKDFKVDLVMVDVPYGNLASWSVNNDNSVDVMLENLKHVLTHESILAVITDKYQKVTHPLYNRLEKFKVGKRVVNILALK